MSSVQGNSCLQSAELTILLIPFSWDLKYFYHQSINGTVKEYVYAPIKKHCRNTENVTPKFCAIISRNINNAYLCLQEEQGVNGNVCMMMSLHKMSQFTNLCQVCDISINCDDPHIDMLSLLVTDATAYVFSLFY